MYKTAPIRKPRLISNSGSRICHLERRSQASAVGQLRRRIESLTEEADILYAIRNDYREVIEHAIEMIFKLDPGGHFTFTSAEFRRALGYENDGLIGRHFTSIIHPQDIPRCLETFQVLLLFGRAAENLNFQVRHFEGHYRWVNCSARCLFDDRGQPGFCIGFAHDITELVRSQEMLALENKRYIEATRAVARAVVDAQEKERAEIGFELHDNVNQILSTARLYLDIARNNENDRINLMNKSSENIAGAISEIRKISRTLVPASICDLGLIVSVNDLIEDIQIAKTLQVEFHYAGDIDSAVSAERKLTVFRIIQEQVTNVLKHAEAALLVVELVADDNNISLTISDNGKGFDMERLRDRKGLGLSNISNRAELVSGTMNIVTAPGKGCKLHILIPLDNKSNEYGKDQCVDSGRS